METGRIALASTDGVHVNEHFGKAQRFLIYDVEEGRLALVADRPAEQLSTGDREHPFDADKFGRIASALMDCSRVYVERIGDRPAATLRELGIEPICYAGAISDIPL